MRYEKALRRRLKNCNGRKVILLGADYFSDFIFDTLKKMQFVDVLQVKELNCNNICLERETFFCLIACYSGHKELVEEIQKRGFKYKEDYEAMNLGGWCEPLTAVDPLLGYCRDEELVPQYKILGSGDYKIIIYGSSTSDIGVGGEENWIQFLRRNIQKKYNVTIYAGAVAGYHLGQELLKCVRDISVIKPHLVIQMSGINDVGDGTRLGETNLIHKYTNRMWKSILQIENIIPDSMDMRGIKRLNCGVRDDRKDYEIFISHMRMMNAICKEFGICFIGCLEPLIAYSDKEEELEKLLTNAGVDSLFYETQMKFRDNVVAGVTEKWFVDLSDFFKGESGMFLDWCHHSSKGAKLLASFMQTMVEEVDALRLDLHKA